MSGLLALLDDVAAIAKLAATQLDDVAAQTAKAGSKAAAVVIDDAAVTPKYVVGLPAARELPIVYRIAKASIFNKLVILLPAALLLDQFLPWLLTPLLMLGGAYLCFEGAEKILHSFAHHEEKITEDKVTIDAAHLEEEKVRGAIKTDFILSAEIMTISLAAIEADGFLMRTAVLAAVAISITVLVYGAVALLVKGDDFGLKLSQSGHLSLTRSIGRGIVKAMPKVLIFIGIVGTAAMLWVGGDIILHGAEKLGLHAPYEVIHHLPETFGLAEVVNGFLGWLIIAFVNGLVGFFIGCVVVALFKFTIAPVMEKLR